MFLTRKKANREIQDAVEKTLSRIPDLSPQVEALRSQIEALQAELARQTQAHADQLAVHAMDLAERIDTLKHDVEYDRDTLVREFHVMGAEFRDAMGTVQPIVPDTRVDALLVQAVNQHEAIRQLDETVNYLLDAPGTVTVIQEVPQPGVMAMFQQHSMVRPLGAR